MSSRTPSRSLTFATRGAARALVVALGLTLVLLAPRRATAGDDDPVTARPRTPTIAPRLRLGDVGELRPTLLAQVRTTIDHPLGEQGGVSADFRLKRLRVGLKLDLFGGRLGVSGRVNLAPGHLEVVDTYVDVDVAKRVMLRAGVAKIPFTRYRMQSTSKLAMVDNALTTRWFGAERQLGVTVTDGFADHFNYAAGVYTGANTRASHAVALEELYGIAPHDPSSLTDPDVDLTVHPEVAAMIGYESAGMGAPVSVDRSGGPMRVAVAVSAAVDTRPDPKVDLAARLAPEIEVRGRHVLARGVAYVGWFASPEGGPWRVGAVGGLAEVTWSAHRYLDLFARWAGVWTTPALATSSGTEAQLTHEVGGGFAVPVVGDQAKWVTDLRWTAHGRGASSVVGRSQVQLAF